MEEKLEPVSSLRKGMKMESTKKAKGEGTRSEGAIVKGLLLPRRVVLQIANEVAKVLSKSLKKRGEKKRHYAKIVNPLFLDTSAIIDGRMFDLVRLGVFYGNFVLLEAVLLELKRIADSKEEVKKERGRRALKMLEDVKKEKNVKLIVLKNQEEDKNVDELIIQYTKQYKGRLITCDYSLSKKAKISNVEAIDIYELANVLKTSALPGEEFWVKIMQKGKTQGQGVGYLPDGTMIVVEEAETLIGKTARVVVSRIIQTDAGKILFAQLKDKEVA